MGVALPPVGAHTVALEALRMCGRVWCHRLRMSAKLKRTPNGWRSSRQGPKYHAECRSCKSRFEQGGQSQRSMWQASHRFARHAGPLGVLALGAGAAAAAAAALLEIGGRPCWSCSLARLALALWYVTTHDLVLCKGGVWHRHKRGCSPHCISIAHSLHTAVLASLNLGRVCGQPAQGINAGALTCQ